MRQKCSIAAGNCLRIVSYSAWDRSLAYRQETISEKFPIRHETEVQYTDRKLFAKGFLSGMGQVWSIAVGNCLRKVFHPAWGRCTAHRQETVCKRFPVRHETEVQHTDRKLFANSFLSGMGQVWSIAVGNCLRKVFHPAWGRCTAHR